MRVTERGFTLVELVMVIVITGVLAASLTIFMKPAIDSYFDTKRRADLTDLADTALRRISKDVRSAVPNSIRPVSGAGCFELVPTVAGGRYRMAPDTVNDSGPLCSPPSATCSAWSDGTSAVSALDVLTPLWDAATSPGAIPVSVGDWIVIGNQNTGDVYSGNNRTRITAVDTPSPNVDFGRHRLSFAAKQFPVGYDGGRLVVVPGNESAVFYSCVGAGVDSNGNGTGTLYRDAGYGFNAAAPTACRPGGAIVATDVAACTFIYDPNQGATQQSGFVWMRLVLQRAGESAALAFGVHVDNLP